MINSQTYSTSRSDRHSKIRESWIVYIEVGNAKFYLDNVCKIDEIDFCLKWGITTISKSHKVGKNREIGGCK